MCSIDAGAHSPIRSSDTFLHSEEDMARSPNTQEVQRINKVIMRAWSEWKLTAPRPTTSNAFAFYEHLTDKRRDLFRFGYLGTNSWNHVLSLLGERGEIERDDCELENRVK
jgi:hypothetical protein